MNTFLQIVFKYIPTESDTKFWGISNDGWFTGIVPVAIFILGYIINKWLDLKKEKRRLKDLEVYFKQIIILLKESVEKQVKELLKTCESLKERREQHLFLNYVTSFNLDQIKEISNKDLYSIFIDSKKGKIKYKAKLYGQLKSSIDFLDVISKSMKLELTQFQQSYDENEIKYKANLDSLERLFNSMVLEFRQSGKEPDTFLVKLALIRKAWFESNIPGQHYTDMYLSVELYVEKYRELCIENMNDPRAVNSINYIMAAKYAFGNIIEAKKVFRKLFLFQARDIQTNWLRINNSLEKL